MKKNLLLTSTFVLLLVSCSIAPQRANPVVVIVE